ncbi:hypothetical protein N7457_000872 [Penicillium paradoxum]|uniref:uncharacterized protein n=1 Tax=Penicillium paradoxum TaxID=176176 RepID=UPI00254735DD|nr:uncharacterized protein N7457_000872 [Penicillium paradoxum]KAJ5794273.1 hypothetical protein N7457_000872 [Penicillium paradoxum]
MPSNGRRTRLWPQPDESTVKQKLLAGEHGADIFGGYRITSCNYNSDSDWYCSHQYTDYPDADSYHSIDRFGFYTSNNPDGSTENLHLKDKKAEYHGPGEQGLEDCSEGMNWKALPNIPDPCFRRVNRLGSWFWKQLKEAEKEQAELEEDLRRMNEWREQQKQPQQPEQQQQQRQRKQQRRRKVDDQQAKVPDALQCSNNSVLELLDDENVQLEDIVPTTVSRSTAKSSGNSEVEISGSASSTTKSFLEAIPQNPTLGKRVEHAGSDLGNNVVQPAPVVNPNETTEIGPARRNTVIPNPPPNKSGTTRKTKKQEPKKQEQRKQEENKRKRSEKEKAEKRHSEEQGTGEKLAETDSHSKDRRKKPKTK